MDYHLDGYRIGDPAIARAAVDADDKPSNVDVLIVGCGPAGLVLAAQLSAFHDISTRIVERKDGPLTIGQADGIACRSIEMFQALGFAEKVTREAYWVNEVTFWRSDPGVGGVARAKRIPDVEEDLSEMPHVILNQARVHDFLLESMRNSPRRMAPDYNRQLVRLSKTDDVEHPVCAVFKCLDTADCTETIRARYVVGCDGAHSMVRTSIGQELKGESSRQLWGVMDILAVTDFPDIRLKTAIQSEEYGSLLIIPREGGYLVRMYIELGKLGHGERAKNRNITPDLLIGKARSILAPFSLDVKEVAWWSAYEIGQRVCTAFDDVSEENRGETPPRIFIAGDACHTHSPKAGQGMNVSMADTFNLGWKLAAVLRGQACPTLLDTYTQERQAKAKELIDFDRDMARLFSARPRTTEEAEHFQRYFRQHGRYTAGVETRYEPSLVTGASHQVLATGLRLGMRFHSAPVIRLADAKPMHLGHALKADGRWRLIAFAPDQDWGLPGGAMARLCDFLANSQHSPIRRYTPDGANIDSVIDTRAVFQQSHRVLDFGTMPPLLAPAKGRYGLTDYEKVFCCDPDADIYDIRGIDRNQGCLVVVRPDQFVARILPLEAVDDLQSFFAGFMIPVTL